MTDENNTPKTDMGPRQFPAGMDDKTLHRLQDDRDSVMRQDDRSQFYAVLGGLVLAGAALAAAIGVGSVMKACEDESPAAVVYDAGNSDVGYQRE